METDSYLEETPEVSIEVKQSVRKHRTFLLASFLGFVFLVVATVALFWRKEVFLGSLAVRGLLFGYVMVAGCLYQAWRHRPKHVL